MRVFLRKPENLILLGIILVLGYLVIVPLYTIIKDTFTIHPSEVMSMSGAIGDLTFEHWKNVLTDGASSLKVFYKPLLNTLLVAASVCVIAILIGGTFAWLVTRTNMPFKNFISTVFMISFIMPSWTLALAWLNFFKNEHIGGVPGIFTYLTGIVPSNFFSYGFFPIVIVLGIHYGPFAYIFIGGVLRNMDSSLEESALILNSSRWNILKRITIPMVVPGLMSTVLLVFSSAMSTFAVPAFLGSPVNFKILSLELYRSLNGVNQGAGYIYAVVLIAIGSGLILLNQLFIGRRRSFATITGKSASASLINLKKLRYPVASLMIVFLSCITVIPLISFALESLLKIPGNYSFANLTGQFWFGDAITTIAGGEPGILKNKQLFSALFNSVSLATLAALIAGTVGTVAGYAIVKRRGTFLSNFVNNLTFFPYIMPSIGIGAAFLSMFAVQRGFIPALYGTFTLLVIAGSVKYLPYASRASASAMLQLGDAVEEAAEIQGISWWKRMTRIIFPIQKSSLISGYLLPFITGMRELSLFILLVTPAAPLLTTMMFQYNEKGWDQFANAIILLIIAIVLIMNWIINKLTGATIDKGIGG